MATRKSPKKATTKKSASKPVLFGLQPEQEKFMTFRVNLQTLYWLILGGVVLLFSMWILQLQSDVQKIYDQIDINTAEGNTVMPEEKDAKN
ncbi:MAG TPA: hypothetical protein PK096_04800 [Candidatus Saccharibacteria bacterium]|nr:hypothetical protein [Candidatus Saccharibacteria bacterium]HRK94654.1 hypothetical protein [Candidatus Saccharibacteria bacterium]